MYYLNMYAFSTSENQDQIIHIVVKWSGTVLLSYFIINTEFCLDWFFMTAFLNSGPNSVLFVKVLKFPHYFVTLFQII